MANSISTADQQNKKKRARKEPFTIKFDSEVDFTTNFSKGRVRSYIFCTSERGFITALFVRTRRNKQLFDHCFSLPWSSGIVSSAKIDLNGNSPKYAGVPHFCTPSFYRSKFPKWCSSVQQDKYCSANAPQLVRRRRRQWVRQKSNRFRLAKQQLCTCITLFCTFLCRRCTTTTWDCLISRFMWNVNWRRFSFFFLNSEKDL